MRSVVAWAGAIALASGSLVAAATSAAAAPAAPPPAPAPVAAADKALREHRAAVQGSDQDRFAVHSSKADQQGRAAVRYTRTYRGLRVYGGDVVIRTKSGGGYLGSSSGLRKPLTLATKPAVTVSAAQAAARKQFTGRITATGKPELFVDASTGLGSLAYETVVRGWAADGQTPSRLHVITDAMSGKLIGSYDEIESIAGTGNSIFSGTVEVQSTAADTGFRLVDPERGNGSTCDMNNTTSGNCVTFTDADNTWGTSTVSDRASAAVDAHFGAAATFDYFNKVHGRDGIFGDGKGVPSRVHYGNNYQNAFWDGAQMTYGDGAGNVKPLVSLDVAGHEMTHGVTENVVPGGLTYSGESGGLNEATSDIFGSMVEFDANAPGDPGDYDIGEKIDIDGDGKPLRYMYNPALDGSSHGCWSGLTKNIDVHYSSGVANHFFFNLAEGSGETAYGNSPLCGTAPAVTGIGREKAEKIWFRALDTYFVSNTSYVNTATPQNTARAHTLSAAADLYGFCGDEYRAVRAAWTSVNVAGEDNCSTGNDFRFTLSAPTATVAPGASVTLTASTEAIRGDAEEITFGTGTLPAGVTATFDPPVVTAGEASTLTLTASDTASSTIAPVTVSAAAASITRTAPLSVTVTSAPGCTASNTTAVPIPDRATVTSTIELTGCAAIPSATSTVEVHIAHTFSGDLIVSLIAPDGTARVLQNRLGGSADNIDKSFAADLSDEQPNGVWTLQVQDAETADTGTLTSWSLSL